MKRFEELAALLSPRLPVQWCAGPEEALAGAVRIDDLYDLACWLAGARVYIGNDSGITHLAAAAGTPVVALFGPGNPRVWAPRGRVRLIAKHDMRAIDVLEVFEAAAKLLEASAGELQ
jgi:ADP-heptose:LPS heptosyltransferase